MPSDKTIRLLSCNNSQSAQEIAQILGRDIVGSTGEMKIFDNGLIQGDNWYIARSNGAVDGFTPATNNLQATGVWRVLRSGGIDDWVTLEAKIRAKLSKTIQSSTLNDMIETMKKSGDAGFDLALKIEDGFCESIDGYIELIKKSSSNEGTLKAVKQALDKAYELVQNGMSKSMLRFEDNPPGYDVDLGIRTAPGSNTYSEAYQFKTNMEPLSKRSLQDASAQLFQAPTNRRIIEFKLVASDNLISIQSNPILLERFDWFLRRKAIDGPIGKRIIIDEFHLIFADGSRVKVLTDNGTIKFINF